MSPGAHKQQSHIPIHYKTKQSTLVHCLDLTLRIDNVSSILLPPLTSHTPATLKMKPVAQNEVWNAIKKPFGFDNKVLAKSTFEGLPQLSPLLLVTHCSSAEAFNSLFTHFNYSLCFSVTV